MTMKIRIEENTYEGTGTEIVDQLRGEMFDPTEFPDTDTYIWFVQNKIIRTTGMECPLPDGNTEWQAVALLYQLAKIGALTILEEDGGGR